MTVSHISWIITCICLCHATLKVEPFSKHTSNHRNNAKKELLLFKPNNPDFPFTARYGTTKFSHLTPAQFRNLYLSDLKLSYETNHTVKPVTVHELRKLHIPVKLDWRTHLNRTVVSAVKNQKKCGGCWAFSTVETVESMVSIATGQAPPTLSVQEVIDCADNNFGCSGGDACLALKWLKDSKTPLVSERAYPLTDTSNMCRVPTSPGVHLKSYQCHRGIQEQLILQLLQRGPVIAAVDARTWQNYQGGVIQYHCGTSVNHAVQLVGYDLTGEVPYYIVRNSWGTDFGHHGYLYIRIGNNVCGITVEISTAAV